MCDLKYLRRQFEPDFSSWGSRWLHHFVDRIHDFLNIRIVVPYALLQFLQLRDDLLVGRERFAHAHERPHDKNTHLDGSF